MCTTMLEDAKLSDENLVFLPGCVHLFMIQPDWTKMAKYYKNRRTLLIELGN